MPYIFNADEIFEMAAEIERNGALFYRAAAERFRKQEQHAMFLELAKMEDEHQAVFEKMRSSLKPPEMETRWDDPEDQIARYLQTFADGYVFDLNEDPKAFVADDSTVGEVLIHAIDKERDSILFYVGMKEMVPESLGKAQINAIIREEMTHVTLLNDCLKAVDGD